MTGSTEPTEVPPFPSPHPSLLVAITPVNATAVLTALQKALQGQPVMTWITEETHLQAFIDWPPCYRQRDAVVTDINLGQAREEPSQRIRIVTARNDVAPRYDFLINTTSKYLILPEHRAVVLFQGGLSKLPGDHRQGQLWVFQTKETSRRWRRRS